MNDIQIGDTFKTTQAIQKGFVIIPKDTFLSVQSVNDTNTIDVLDIEKNIRIDNLEKELFTNYTLFSVSEYFRKQILDSETEREDEHLLDLEFI